MVRYVANLQNVETTTREDKKSLHVRISDTPISWTAQLLFDDAIRCMTCKRYLDNGRAALRRKAMDLITQLLRIRAGPGVSTDEAFSD